MRKLLLVAIAFAAFTAAVPEVSSKPKVKVYPVPFQPKAGSHMSRGFGLTVRELEAVYGPAEKNTLGDFFFRNRTLRYASDLGTLTYDWETTGLVSLKEAKARAKNVIPADARLVRSRPGSEEGQVVEVYTSRWLPSRFRSWNGAKPGTFVVQYNRMPGEQFFECIIGTGTEM